MPARDEWLRSLGATVRNAVSAPALPDILRSSPVTRTESPGGSPCHRDDFPRLYRRLVPRIIRPLVAGRFHVSEELIATRLVEAGWSTWEAPLADALRNVWTAWWQATLHTYPSPVSIRDTLAVITVATGSLRPWLDTWTVTRTPAADTHLADLMDDVLCEYEITDLSLGFYSEYHATAELVEWLLTDVRDRVTDSRLDDPDFIHHLQQLSSAPTGVPTDAIHNDDF